MHIIQTYIQGVPNNYAHLKSLKRGSLWKSIYFLKCNRIYSSYCLVFAYSECDILRLAKPGRWVFIIMYCMCVMLCICVVSVSSTYQLWGHQRRRALQHSRLSIQSVTTTQLSSLSTRDGPPCTATAWASLALAKVSRGAPYRIYVCLSRRRGTHRHSQAQAPSPEAPFSLHPRHP